MKEVVDINGEPLKENDRVICMETSIIMAPICTHPFYRPQKIGKRKRKPIVLDPKDDADAVRIKQFNGTVRHSRLHRDLLLGKNNIQRLNPGKTVRMDVLTIKTISNGHLMFWNDKKWSQHKRIEHFHPSRKFMKLKKRKTS